MTDINLLPGGLVKRSSISKAIKVLKTINIVGTLLLGFVILVISGGLVINTVSLNNINNSVDSLKTKVKSLQSTEQQFSFVKGRVESINKIYTDKNISKEISSIINFYSSSKDDSDINTLNIVPDKTNIIVTFESTSKLKVFLTKLSESEYSRIVIDGISFSPNVGYQVTVNFFR